MSTDALPQRRLALPLTVVGLAAYWVGIVALVHVLEPEFNPFKVSLSGYVLGTYWTKAGAILVVRQWLRWAPGRASWLAGNAPRPSLGCPTSHPAARNYFGVDANAW
jgi:hypothetical protein